MTERNNVFRKHPKTRFIAAHFGWHANDLARAAKMLDEFPNVSVECGAILYDLGRQPRAAARLLREVPGSHHVRQGLVPARTSIPYYWRVFETTDEYFDYYRDYHAFWKLYGMGLPDAVLKKLYAGQRTARDQGVAGGPEDQGSSEVLGVLRFCGSGVLRFWGF